MGKKVKSKNNNLGTVSDNSLRKGCENVLPCGRCKLTGKQCSELYIPYVPNYPIYPTYPDYPVYPTFPPLPEEPPYKFDKAWWQYFPEYDPKVICDPIPNINNQSICTGSDKDGWAECTSFSKKK